MWGWPDLATWTGDTASKGSGNPAGPINAHFVTATGYDSFGRVASVTETKDGNNFVTATGYDLYSRPETLRLCRQKCLFRLRASVRDRECRPPARRAQWLGNNVESFRREQRW